MADRRTRDQLRRSNDKLREAIRKFVTIQDDFLAIHDEQGLKVPGDWKEAYDAMKELMGSQATSEGKDP